MRDNEISVDIEKLHQLFMSGEKLSVIAYKFQVSEGYIQRLISNERKQNPDKWPKRKKKKQTMEIDIYSCEECGRAFGVEECEDPKVCPCCESELWEYSHSVKITI